MKHLYKKISLEPYISRQCGIIPSYESGYDTIVSFDPTTSMTSNYGMIPMSVSFDDKYLSYSELIFRYHFCKDYIKLLTTNHQCKNIKYNSAIDYYEHEIQYKTIELENEYREKDKTFIEYGGYDLISFCEDKCFPTFIFEEHFKNDDILDAWNVHRMSFVDINKWVKKLEELEIGDDCDKCRYEELYGNEVKSKMNDWLKNLLPISECSISTIDIPILFTTSIENLGEFTIFSKDWNEGEDYGSEGATVIFNDDLYEFNPNGNDFGSLYSTKYKENYFPNEDAIKGTWMEEWLGKSSNELKYNKSQWNKKGVYVLDIIPELRNLLIKDEKDKILNYLEKLKYDFYSFKDGLKTLLPKDEDETKYKDVMSYQYNIDTNNGLGFFYIKGNLYRVFESEYIIYDNEICLIYDFESSNIGIKYCTINGIKYYSYYENNSHKININGSGITLNGDIGSFIYLNDTPILIEDNQIKLYDKLNECYIIYNKFDGITEVDGNIIYINDNESFKFNRKYNGSDIEYVNDNTILTYVGWYYNSDSYNKEKLYEISGNTLYFHKPYKIYDKTKTTGYTETKLSLLIDDVVAYDDMGNKLPCSLNKDSNGNYKHPSHNELMDINFHVGNTSQISFLFNNNYFGNIITDIFYYYNDSFGNKVCTSTTINGTIELKEKFNADYNRNGFVINKLMCDITYYIGAILIKDINNNKYTYSNGGVKYIDSITLEESVCSYYRDEFDSIILKYYNFIYDSKYVVNNEYNNSKNSVNMAYFEINKEKNSGINDDIIDKIIEKVEENIKNLFTIKIPLSEEGSDAEETNLEEPSEGGEIETEGENEEWTEDELIDDQIFREEYKLGIATKEKIESNVYIDRGTSSSFEKHLKILDINSLESLEQLGINFFNIKNN